MSHVLLELGSQTDRELRDCMVSDHLVRSIRCLKSSSIPPNAIHLTVSMDTAITSSWFTHKYAVMKNGWGILCRKINYLSLQKVSTPPLSVWSLPAGLLSILLHRSAHTHTHRKDFTSHQSFQPLFLHFGVFVSQTLTHNTHMHTSAPPTLVSLNETPASPPVVMLITCLLCFSAAHHPSKRLPAFHLTQCISTCN